MSHIQKEIVDFLDQRLENNELAKHAIAAKDARTLMVEAAKCFVGVREKTNNNDGVMVELIQKTIGGAAHESWCMSFIQTCAIYAAMKCGVKTKLFESEHCLTVWNKTPSEQRVKMIPLPGAVKIYQHGKSSDGHTGIVLASDGVTDHCIEANTTAGSNAPNGKIERNGGGCYFTVRPRKGVGDMHLVGYLKPF
jgi:hypothetical protein